MPAIQAICPDPDIVKKLKCGKRKCEATVKNVIGRKERDNLLVHLREFFFSLIVDKSTDRGCTKHLAIVVRVATRERIKD